MQCKHCGALLKEGANFCEHCGTAVEQKSCQGTEDEAETQVLETNKETEPIDQIVDKASWQDDTAFEETNRNSKAMASLVLGIIAVLFCGLPIIGVPVSIIGLVLAMSSKKQGASGLATAGLVLNIIGLVLSVLVFLSACFLIQPVFWLL